MAGIAIPGPVVVTSPDIEAKKRKAIGLAPLLRLEDVEREAELALQWGVQQARRQSAAKEWLDVKEPALRALDARRPPPSEKDEVAARRAALREEVDDARRKYEREAQVYGKPAHAGLGTLVRAARALLSGPRALQLRPITPLPAVLKRLQPVGLPTSAFLDEVRAEIRECAAEHERIERARVPREEARARAEAYVEDMTAQFSHPAGIFTLASYVTPGPLLTHPEALAHVLNGLFPALYLEALLNGIDRAYQPGERTVSSDERPRALAEVTAKRRNLEVLEELAVRRMRLAGLAVARRGDAEPEVVLMLEDNIAPA